MRYDKDPSRAAILRDLLMNYSDEYRPPANAPMLPPEAFDVNGEYNDVARDIFERFENDPKNFEFLPEGNYPNAEGGRPDARVSPPGMMLDDELGEYLRQRMPQVEDSVQDVPPGPGGGRPHMLAQRLRRG